MENGDWDDPMKEDYNNPSFNCYKQGVGQDLQYREQAGNGGRVKADGPQPVDLYVQSLPMDMDEEALTNLFSRFCTVIEVHIPPAKPSYKLKIGFVTVASARDAQNAIENVDGFMVREKALKVAVKLQRKEMERRKQNRERVAALLEKCTGMKDKNDGTGEFCSQDMPNGSSNLSGNVEQNLQSAGAGAAALPRQYSSTADRKLGGRDQIPTDDRKMGVRDQTSTAEKKGPKMTCAVRPAVESPALPRVQGNSASVRSQQSSMTSRGDSLDETYQQIELNLKSKGPGSGRGRPPSLPAVATITNRLLLQLGLLRHSLHTTWKTMEDVSLQILSVQFGKDLPHLFGLVDRALRNLPTNNDQLNTYLATVRDFSYPKDSPFCQKFGLTRGFLLGTENDLLMEMEQHTSVPCGLVMELCKFKSEHNLTLMKGNVVHTWLSHLCPSLDVSVRELTLKVAQLKKDYQKHMKAKSRRPTALADFLNSSFSCAPRFFSCSTQEAVVSVHDASSSTSSSSTLASNSSPPRKCSKHCKDSVIDAVHLKLQAKVKQQEDQLSQLHTEQTVLKEVCVGQQLTINTLHRSLTAVTEDLDSVATSLEASSTQLMEVKRDNATLKRNATNVQASKDAVLRHAAEHRQQQKELQRVQDQAAGLQKELASTKANLNKTSAAVTTLRQRLKQKDVLLREAEHKIADAEANHTELTIRNDNGHYKDSVKTCVIQLMGECDVSSAKVSHVMSTVVTNLLQKPVPPSEFPSKTTALRYADIGSALSRMQVLQALTANRFDLHVDGTSRDHKKMLGHQVTLQDNRQLSLGFTPVDKEDSTTLVEVTINLLAEIASVMNTSDEEKNKLMKEIFTNLTSTMTDRAATMKLFGKKLAEAKQDLLGDNDGLEFLFCTAHFLLGLSEAVDKGLSAVELENGWAKSLGRDTISAFTHFKASAKDPAACRLIRLACDVFGPRGDEKSGCRDEWLAHCAEVGKRSVFGSFRSNRFNNLFEGAAAVIHHREDIINFLSGKETLNLKLRSVKLDVEDQTICLMVTSMAALYVTVTGPFWRLINSEVHYLDLYIYVQSLEHHLQMIVDTPGAVRTMLESLPTCIDGFTIFQTPLVQTVRAECRRCSANEALKHTTQVLAMNFLTVIRRQLADFLLPDGQYSSPPSELMRERLAHCKMTNLFGEANFGDLDLSLYNRRHCSLHHHSSVNTLRRNKTVSWFQEQTSADQQRLMNLATLMGKGVREQNRTKEKEVLRQTQERLKQQRDELAQKQAAKEQRKRDIQQKVTAQVAEVCANCGGSGVNRCGGCKSVHYCSQECQASDWPQHKKVCAYNTSVRPAVGNQVPVPNIVDSDMEFGAEFLQKYRSYFESLVLRQTDIGSDSSSSAGSNHSLSKLKLRKPGKKVQKKKKKEGGKDMKESVNMGSKKEQAAANERQPVGPSGDFTTDSLKKAQPSSQRASNMQSAALTPRTQQGAHSSKVEGEQVKAGAISKVKGQRVKAGASPKPVVESEQEMLGTDQHHQKPAATWSDRRGLPAQGPYAQNAQFNRKHESGSSRHPFPGLLGMAPRLPYPCVPRIPLPDWHAQPYLDRNTQRGSAPDWQRNQNRRDNGLPQNGDRGNYRQKPPVSSQDGDIVRSQQKSTGPKSPGTAPEPSKQNTLNTPLQTPLLSTPLLSTPLHVDTSLPVSSMDADSMSVLISHMDSPQSFWVHEARRIIELVGKIAEAVQSRVPVVGTVTAAKQGDVFLCQFESVLCRARVEAVRGQAVVVFYLDYGNTEKTKLDCLLPLPDDLGWLPALAMHCSLPVEPCGGRQWPAETTSILRSLFPDSKLATLTPLDKVEDLMVVRLVRQEDGLDAAAFLIENKMAVMPTRMMSPTVSSSPVAPTRKMSPTLSSSPVAPTRKMSPTVSSSPVAPTRKMSPTVSSSPVAPTRKMSHTVSSPSQQQTAHSLAGSKSLPKAEAGRVMVSSMRRVQDSLEVGQYLEVRFMDSDGPDDLFLHISQLQPAFDHFVDSMTQYYSRHPQTNFLPELGELVAGRFSGDGRWYRAEVVEKVPDKQGAVVYYVDFGNKECLPLGELRPMQPDFASLPVQGMRCRVCGVLRVADKWPQALLTPYKELLLKFLSPVRDSLHGTAVVKSMSHQVVEIDLVRKEMKLGLAELLLSLVKGRAVSQTSPAPLPLTSPSLSKSAHSASPVDNTGPKPSPALSCSVSPLAAWHEPSFFPGQTFSRASQRSDAEPPVSTLESSIPALESSIPALEPSIPALESSIPALESSIPLLESSIPLLETSIPPPEPSLSAAASPMTSSLSVASPMTSSLSASSLSAVSLKTSSISAPASTAANAELVYEHLAVGDQLFCTIQEIITSQEFYVSKSDNEEMLIQLGKQLKEFCTGPVKNQPPRDLHPGSLVLAQFSVDKEWYRGRIESISADRSSCLVFFVDYGSREEKSLGSLMAVPSGFLSLAAQAIQCKLAGVASSVAAENEANFKNIFLQIKMELNVVERQGQVCVVDLFTKDKKDLALLLGLKIAITSSATLASPSSSATLASSSSSATLASSSSSATLASPSSSATLASPPSPGQAVAASGAVMRGDVPHVEPQEVALKRMAVLHVDNPAQFFCMDINSFRQQMTILTELDDVGKTCCAVTTPPCVGQLLCGLFSDGWYRCEVLSVDSQRARVVFCDYGNEAVLDLADLRPLSKEFCCQFPIATVKCSLHDIQPVSGSEWDEESVRLAKSLLSDKFVSLTVKAKVGDTWQVAVTLDTGDDVASLLVQDKRAVRTDAQREREALMRQEEALMQQLQELQAKRAALH